MKKINTSSFLILLTLSIFLISNHFVSSATPTIYFFIGGCYVLTIVTILTRCKQERICLSAIEIVFGSFLLFTIASGALSGNLSPDWVISGFSLFAFFLAIKRTELSIQWLFLGLLFIGIAQSFYGLGQYVYWLSNNASIMYPTIQTVSNLL